MLLIPTVTSERGLSVVVSSTWLEILTKGDVATRAKDDVDLDDVTERDDKGIAALIGAAIPVGGRRAFLVIIVDVAAAVETPAAGNVVVAARTRRDKGVRFLAGCWMVGVGGLN